MAMEKSNPVSGQEFFKVVSPLGEVTVEERTMVPRLDTLEGKTICLMWNGSFKSSLTLPVIAELLLKKYPTAKVIPYTEMPRSFKAPAPGITSPERVALTAAFKEKGCGAVISGNGGWGECTPQAAGTVIIAEQLGIPGVVVTAPGFAEQARITGYNNAVPSLQVAVYPGAFDTHTDSELAENTRTIVFPQLVESLTKPIKAAEKRAKVGGSRTIVFTGTFDELNRYFLDMKWSDGLPIVPPTVERVLEFLKYADCPPTEEIAVLQVANLRATPWNIAVNGVMAGCRPEFMPLLIAYVKAIGDPAKGPGMFFGSTHSWIPYLWVNGPLARQLNIDHGQGLIGHPTNRVIGRAIGLIVRNLAGFREKETAMGTYGYTVPWVLAEDEKFLREVGWEPYHVEKGFDRNVSTVTASTATSWGQNNIPALSVGDVTTVMQLIAREITYKEVFASGSIGSQRIELISPPVAKVLAAGYKTKGSLIADLVKTARKPTFEAAFSKLYGSFGPVYGTFEEILKDLLASPDAEKRKLPPWYPRFPGWEEIVTTPCITAEKVPEILVCGDANRNKTQTLPGGSVSTQEVKLPANWDKLMAELGYPALKECILE